uniref:Uncharacterized protein n=1 Tax=Tetradesmus obliquus TaxID=3088 RepID=A0A383VKZ7_TETOB|eukprot:jgi/Sobl393_1/18617/SZX65354.1
MGGCCGKRIRPIQLALQLAVVQAGSAVQQQQQQLTDVQSTAYIDLLVSGAKKAYDDFITTPTADGRRGTTADAHVYACGLRRLPATTTAEAVGFTAAGAATAAVAAVMAAATAAAAVVVVATS